MFSHIRIKKSSAKYSYALSPQSARIIRGIGAIGILSLVPMVYGFYLFASQSFIAALVSSPFYTVTVIYLAATYLLMTFYPSFDVAAHKNKVIKFNRRKRLPHVAVFIPVAGEDLRMVTKTVSEAQNMTYKNFTVFILDDSRDAKYESLASQLKVGYLRRENIGFEKKAGNINDALKKIKGYKYILVLDADFIPRPEMISELVPYAEDGAAIIQSPQHFDTSKKTLKRSKIEHGAGILQQNFYKIIQPARDRFGAAMCVGTNALYNIAALKKVGGFEGVGDKRHAQAEDVHTGLKLLNTRRKNGSRFSIKYIPIQLAQGRCPDDHHSFYKQQNRWATGSMQLIFTRKTLFSRELSTAQRLIYATGPLYYLDTIGTLFLPVLLFFILLTSTSFDGANSLLFIPGLLVTAVFLPYVLRHRISPISTSIVTVSNTYTFLQALVLMIVKRPLGWEASGVKAKKKSYHFTAFHLSSALFFSTLYIVTFIALIVNEIKNPSGAIVILILFFISFTAHMVYFGYALLHELQLKTLHLQRNFYAYVSVVLIVSMIGFNGFTYKNYFDIAFSTSSLIKIVPQTSKVASNYPPKESSKPATPIFNPISVTASEGDTNWSLATEMVHKIRGTYVIPNGQAGKLHDRLLQNVGYSNSLAIGQTYTFTHDQILEMLKLAYVYPEEQIFWDDYSYTSNVAHEL